MGNGVVLFVRHRVADYDAWRKEFDAAQPMVQDAGGQPGIVHQSVDEPHDITVVAEFESAEKAQEFVRSDGLREAMKKAGVEGTPSIWITELR